MTEVIPLLNAPCNIPKILDGAEPLDFTDAAAFETTFATLVARLCPPAPVDTGHIDALVDLAWDAALAADPGGLDAEPSAPRDAILEALLRFPIDGAETEGLAVTGFLRAARLLLRDQQRAHPAAYNMQMLLGECVGVAVQRHPRYRQIAQRFLDLQPADSPDPVVAFVVVRAYSKLAEIDPTLIDAGALLRVAALLDSSPPLNNKKASAAMLLGRVAAKLRGNDMGDLLIQVLSEGGAAARIAAIGAISMAEAARASSAFYTSAFAALHATTGASTSEPSIRPRASSRHVYTPSTSTSRLWCGSSSRSGRTICAARPQSTTFLLPTAGSRCAAHRPRPLFTMRLSWGRWQKRRRRTWRRWPWR